MADKPQRTVWWDPDLVKWIEEYKRITRRTTFSNAAEYIAARGRQWIIENEPPTPVEIPRQETAGG